MRFSTHWVGEDLDCMCKHTGHHPAGNIAYLLAHDEQVSGIALDDVVAANLRSEVLPAVTGRFARNRAEMVGVLTETLERVHRIGLGVATIEWTELTELLGMSVTDLRAGLRMLDRCFAT